MILTFALPNTDLKVLSPSCPRAGFNEPVPNELSLQLASGLNRWGRDSAKFLIGFALVFMRKQAVESAKSGSWIFYEGGWLSVLSTGTGKTKLLIETLASALRSHPLDQLIWSGRLDDFIYLFTFWFKTWPVAPQRIHLKIPSRGWLPPSWWMISDRTIMGFVQTFPMVHWEGNSIKHLN